MEKKKKTGPDECCRAERQIGYEVRTLNQVIGRLVNSYQSKVDEKAGINRMQGWIIGYLYRHSEEAVFQKDLEAEFQMARSTASGNPSGNGEERAYYQRTYSKRCQTEASGAYRKGNGISDGNYGEF